MPYEHTDLSALPREWQVADTLLLQAMPDGLETITAANTVVCCGHSELAFFRKSLPDAVYAVEGGAVQFRAQTTLHE